MIIATKTLAWFGAAGTLSDAVGGVYLTYDLLGGREGPLGLGTRAATYGLIFALGYGVVFGPVFGAVAGFGLGGILALEFWRVAYYQRKFGVSPLNSIGSFGAARGVVLGLASVHQFGWRFGAVFGILCAAVLALIYRLRYAPTHDYEPAPHLVLRRHALMAALMRAIGVGLAGATAGWVETRHWHAAGFGLTIGLVVASISWIVGIVSPRVEHYIEHLPERHLAAFGFAMIALGLLLQSVQYLVVIAGP